MPPINLEELEQQLKDERNFLNILMQASPDTICLSDMKGKIIYMSPRGLSQLGLESQAEITGRNITELLAPQDQAIARERYVHAVHDENNAGLREYLFLRKDGSTFHAELNGAILREPDGTPSGMLYVARDISDRKKIEAALHDAYIRLQHQAVRDPLTDLFNRRYMEETLERELARCLREELPLSIVMMDIDYFKNVNDSYGHKAGDVMLKSLSGLLQSDTRGEDIVCRYGGEEFVAILPSAAPNHAIARAEGWRRAFEALRIPYETKTLNATLSCGVATFPQNGDNSEDLIRAADKALYKAKADGRNCVKLANKLH